MLPLTGLPSVSTSVSSRSGDAGGGYDGAFQYNAAFQVGGSGSTVQSQDARQDKVSTPAGLSGGSNVLVYVALGTAFLAILVSSLGARRAK